MLRILAVAGLLISGPAFADSVNVNTYSGAVDAPVADKNRETMATLEEENRRRAESVKPSQKSVKPDRNEDQS